VSFQRILERLARWKAAEVAASLLAYLAFAAVLGVALVPSVVAILACAAALLAPALSAAALPPIASCVLFALALAGSLYLFFFWGLLVVASLVRLLSLGVRPGRHAPVSGVTLAWMVLNGVFLFAQRLMLPMVPMTFFSETFFRIVGCRIGRGVRINSFLLIDPYLIEIGDGTVIGGDAILSPHAFEDGALYLAPIRIGRDCLIGAGAYISPGVTVGDGSTIGLRAYVRRNRRIPPGSRIHSLAGLGPRRTYELERGPRGLTSR
jgi:hypothetical protein